jgi:tRNA nucleotidyltransferase/poly(A) polymerase
MRNVIRKIFKEESEWFEDVLSDQYFIATPELLTVGVRMIIDGYETNDDGGATESWSMEPGTLISIEEYDGNDIILVKFDNWACPTNIVDASSPMWRDKREDCKDNSCWSFMKDNSVSYLDKNLIYYVLNPNHTEIKESEESEWFDDIEYPDEVPAKPEQLKVGTEVFVNGPEGFRQFNLESGIIVDEGFSFAGNNLILVRFDDWYDGGDNYNSTGNVYRGHENSDCQPKRCWSFLKDTSLYGETLVFYLKNNKKQLKEDTIRKELVIELPESILRMNRIFKENGHELYVVGGAVRDTLNNQEPKDFDLATDATPDKVKSMLHMYRTIDLGEQFAIVNVITEDGQYEIATFRKDLGKGRRPDAVEFTTIDQDVLRRDLTMNALFYDIDSGEIVDLVGGISDIEKNIVRTVGSASERFDEDKLRILRAFRFAARVGSEIDKDIEEAIRKDKTPVSGNGLSLSQERIRDEFLKGIKQAQSVGYFIQMITKYNLWDWIFSRLVITTEPLIETKNYIILIASLLKSNDAKLVEKTLVDRLKYTSDESKQISFLIQFLDINPSNAFKLREKFELINLTEDTLINFARFNDMNMKLVEAFLKYRITTSGDALKRRGLVGKEIGNEKERLEKDIFEKLITESKKRVAYSGIVLTDKSRSELIQFIKTPGNDLFSDWEILAHHMTINMGELKEEYRPLLGQSFDLLVTHVGQTDKVLAVKVETPFITKNKDPHITIAINKADGGKPADANKIEHWKSVYPFEVEGRLEEVPF